MKKVFRDLFSVNGPYARFMNWLWHMILISMLWVLCSIPVVTSGAASTAAYYAMAKAVRRHTGTVVSEFFRSFRENFRQATVLSVLLGLIQTVLIGECILLYSNPEIPLAMLYLFYFLTGIAAACAAYTWPCLSRFVKSTFLFVKMTLLLTFRHLITTVLLLLLLLAALVGIYLMPWGVLVLPGLMFFLQTYLLEPVLLRYSPKPAEGNPEADKWYYQ